MSSLSIPNQPSSVTSSLNPNKYFSNPTDLEAAKAFLAKNDLRSAIVTAFHLEENDNYVYHAVASVTLAQVQSAVDAGRANGLCNWYIDDETKIPLDSPPDSDITAYTSIFLPENSAANALKSLSSNAKKLSLRASIATYLESKRHLDPSIPAAKKKKKKKSTSNTTTTTPITPASTITTPAEAANPYLAFWIWSCYALAWAGPTASTSRIRTSHAILPVFMHHFGCACPSAEAITMIRHVARGRSICDIGSGNGYWTYVLRSAAMTVHAVDSGQSSFRCAWIGDTVLADGERWLKARGGAGEMVMLLVYPVVGGRFLERMVGSYRGDVVVVVGTQGSNGYTACGDQVVDEWMCAEGRGWVKSVQIALPSFAGKDEALFVFERDGVMGMGM